MSESEEDSIGLSISSESEFSDCDSRDESPSSGYVDDESASVRSVSTANSDSKKKKRVTFQSGKNLVLIREIPARSLLSRWTLESDSESDCEGEGVQRAEISHNNCIAKGNYEVRKSTGRVTAKVAAITGATLPKKSESKRTTKRRSAKKEKRKETSLSESNRNEDISKTMKGKSARSKGGKKCGVKSSKSKSMDKNEQKDSQSEETGSRSRLKAPYVTTLTQHCERACNEAGKPSAKESDSASRLMDLLDRNTDPIKKIENVYIVEEEFSQSSRDFMDAIIQSSDRVDVRSMSKTNRRLYSWLMANGNIPSPQQESPCIAPMWDSSCGAAHGTYNSVVKAPT